MKKILSALALLTIVSAHAQIFEMKKTYTGYHYGFGFWNPDGLNKFVVSFNDMYRDDLKEYFTQYSGRERGMSFTTSGFRFIVGKKETKWTFSTDYAFGAGKEKNEAVFKNGITQHMVVKFRTNQVNFSFGITKKENKVWIEGLYCTNLAKVIIEYSTEHLNGVNSFGTEYRLNGIYIGTIKTMELGAQFSYKWKKNVFYTRILYPIAVIGPDKGKRNFVDDRSGYEAPNDFPSDYNSYVNDPAGYAANNGALQSTGMKGLSFGFGMFHLIGKDK
ncbi:MAG TPA: hypothetical protein VK826_09460 [Bacteroidia bacterium]|nr:hypothetical protein [Bacteroidia bacterium]